MTNAVENTMKKTSASMELHFEAQQFLFAEAALLDGRAYSQWYDLLDDDLRYYMPARVNQKHGSPGGDYYAANQLALFDENKKSIWLRVNRFIIAEQTGMVPAEAPSSVYRRMVSNVQVSLRENENEVEVKSLVLLQRTRGASTFDQFLIARNDVLRTADTPLGWRIASRIGYYDVATVPSNNLNTLF